jgi:hypothetical protein
MPQRNLKVHFVATSVPFAIAAQIAGRDEIPDDRIRRPFRHAHGLGYLAEANSGIAGDDDEGHSVVGKERPSPRHGAKNRARSRRALLEVLD